MTQEIKRKFFDPNIPRKSKLLDTHLEGDRSRETKPPFFSLIEFNLSGLCNRTCVFCPRVDPKVFPNVNEHIPVELYEKIMRELAEVDYDGTILFSAFGEPLLYKRLNAVLRITKQYLPNAHVESVTNGDRVTVKKLQSLFAAGLDTLLISMYDGPEQEDHFAGLRDKAGLTDKQVILRKRWLPPEEHYGITLSNRGGMVDLSEAGVEQLTKALQRPCYYPFYQVLVDWDGAVLLCPHDWGKKLVVGNLHHQSIHELWESRLMRKVRESLNAGNRSFAPCNKCNVDGTLMGGHHAEAWMSYYERQEKQ